MKRLLISLAIVSTMFAGAAMAASAKFAAVYEDRDDFEIVVSDACASTETGKCAALGITTETADTDEVTWGAATIKVPKGKELLVGLSAQVALYTITEVKGKKGTRSRAFTSAEGGVTMYACPSPWLNGDGDPNGTCVEAEPGYITLSKREQDMAAVLGGVLESCTWDEDLGEDGAGTITFSASDCIFLDELVSLGVNTMAAHHFNFLFPDMGGGEYDIIAKFMTSAAATAEVTCEYTTTDCDPEEGSATGQAGAAIGKTMLTVQTVRAVKGSLGRGEVIEILAND